MRIIKIILIVSFVFYFSSSALAQTKDLLSPEESLWLEQRNNIIVVYPEQNNPPYSYQSPAGNIQGLSIDYIELIADKIGVKIEYLTPRSRNQILTDLKAGKGEIAFLTPDKAREEYLLFTESYVTVPVVIVVRKDYDNKSNLTLNDFNGKKVAVIASSLVESYINLNYPRVVREAMSDDEVSLQQVVLGEVDSAVMDVASLSFYLSKQVLSSVKIAGNTGLDYKPAFAITKDKAILQSILEKGLSQISGADRNLLAEKWVSNINQVENDHSLLASIQSSKIIIAFYIIFGIGLVSIIILLIKNRSRGRFFRKRLAVEDLQEEMVDLEKVNKAVVEELKEIKATEDKLAEKIDLLKK